MPNIRTITFYDDGEQKVKASVRADGVFRASLPDHIATALGMDKGLRSENLDDLEKQFLAKIQEYKAILTTDRKVILAQFEATAYVFDRAADKIVLKKDDISFTEGVALSVNAAIAKEIKRHQGGEKYSYRYECWYPGFDEEPFPASYQKKRLCGACDGPGGHEVKVFEWTQQREDFFAGMGRAIEGIIMKLDTAFGDTDQFLKLIDSGQQLLPAANGREATGDIANGGT